MSRFHKIADDIDATVAQYPELQRGRVQMFQQGFDDNGNEVLCACVFGAALRQHNDGFVYRFHHDEDYDGYSFDQAAAVYDLEVGEVSDLAHWNDHRQGQTLSWPQLTAELRSWNDDHLR